jgi:hypothetical protein
MLFDDTSSSSPDHGDARSPRPQRPAFLAKVVPPPEPLEARRPSPEALEVRQPPAEGATAAEPPDAQPAESAGAPAPEALRATAVAATVVRELYESGREVRFAFVPTRKRVAVLLCDVDGGVLSRLTPARALEIATGEPIPGASRG